MINIDNSSIENVLVGDVLVDRVYLGTDIVWEHSLPVVTRNYLKFTAIESGTFTLTIPANVNATHLESVSYSLDNGATWVTTQNTSSAVTITTPTVAEGGTVLWKGSGKQTAVGTNNNQFSSFSSTASFTASGNIMSLLYESTFENQNQIEANYALSRLFYRCSTIIEANSLELPATTLTESCYREMFDSCNNLVEVRFDLPAPVGPTRAYQSILGNCGNLVTANVTIYAHTLQTECCWWMCGDCRNLTTAPVILATILEGSNALKQTFYNCSKLQYIKALFLTEPSSTHTDRFTSGVANSGTFVKNRAATWTTTGVNAVPTGWAIEYVTMNYLKFTALESGTFSLRLPPIVNAGRMTSVSYSVDDGATWVTTINDDTDITITTPTIATGDSVLWKGTGVVMAYHYNANNFSNFSSTGSFAASGNIMSLLFENTFENEKVLPNNRYTFLKLFTGCTGMTTPPELPATTLRNGCYTSLFSGCTSLTSMPTLPATTLVDGCYDNMFNGCSSLTNTTDLIATSLSATCYYEMFAGCTSLVIAPRIKARTFYSSSCYMMFNGCSSLTTIPEFVPEVVGTNCCRYMFRNCTSLTVAPDLPATTLADSCYNAMFSGCSSLVNIQNELPATTLAKGCYQQMFYGCPLQKAPDLPALTLVQDCYYQMFMGCRLITSLKCLATDISASSCTYQWLRIVADSATFIKNAEMSSWTRDMNGIPEGWTVVDADD